MSRHSSYCMKDGVKYEVVCGYDRPCAEFFLQVYKEAEDGVQDIIFDIANYASYTPHPEFPNKTRWSNGDLMDLMKKWGCREEYIKQIALDLPF